MSNIKNFFNERGLVLIYEPLSNATYPITPYINGSSCSIDFPALDILEYVKYLNSKDRYFHLIFLHTHPVELPKLSSFDIEMAKAWSLAVSPNLVSIYAIFQDLDLFPENSIIGLDFLYSKSCFESVTSIPSDDVLFFAKILFNK